MEIVSCPKCGRPRALGHRCPSCGDVATAVDQQPTAPAETGSWRPEAETWQGAAEPGRVQAGQAHAAQKTQRGSGGKKGRGLLATVIVAVVVIAIVAVVAVVLTTGSAAIVEEQASVAAAPQKAYDQAAQSLLRNAMTAMDSAFAESADYTAVTQDVLKATEPAIAWMQGSAGVSASPSAGAKAQQNAVSWASTGRMSYELGTWSASGAEFGVRVNKSGGGAMYYKDGAAGAW